MCSQVWETVSGKCVATLTGHKEEVLDVCFDLSGQLIATASADGETTLQSKDYIPSKTVLARYYKHTLNILLVQNLRFCI